MTRVNELAYVVYEVADLADWERFAVDLLGMQIGERTADSLTLRMDAKAHRWICERGPADDLAASGYAVAGAAALDTLVARLRAAGVTVAEGDAALAAARKVERIAVTADPLGNRIELVVGLADAPAPFASERLLGGFVTGRGGAGHVVLTEQEAERADLLAFYTDLLGFAVSDFIDEEIQPGIVASVVFLHCNERHHSLAFAGMPFPKRIHHFMVEAANMLDVGRAYDRCMDAGQRFEMTLGMHPNDRMFSFYVRTPSGFNVEFGWGGLVIDEATWKVQHFDELSSWGHRPPEVVSALLQA
ncbi:2,3-dihydroxybiphenyl 1,2-dioxygenase [Actinocorallia herbida]|uniref:2,3-dihydroxybiphenyl 1,2-dioxygenase n=1 Tax=Actinocorallia herbida TaxID=58109 RepID=A0A3N1D2W2_9ACTN|nr:VOC family protein [Actinocorallia herbida]ROO87408.1 2,3-dihydroxybiphenyl 1,2-dioxygenase [Actinocorallia herbida]